VIDKKTFLLGGQEQLTVCWSGQCLFLPRAVFETKVEGKSRTFLHSSDLYVGKSKWIYIEKNMTKRSKGL